MNIKKVRKIFTILMFIATIALAFSMILSGSVNALSVPSVGEGTQPPADLTNVTGAVLNIVAYICYTAAVILLIMLGIKYMTQSPDGKAEIKKSAVIYVVGALLVFAAGVVLTVLQNIFKATVSTT